MKIGVFIIHYYSNESLFSGKSKLQAPGVRREILTKCIEQFKSLKFNTDIRICGYRENYLVELTDNYDGKIDDPQLIMYEVLSELKKYTDYDYIIVAEDDILVNEESIRKSILFAETMPINYVYHPHRLEVNQHLMRSIDIELLPGKSGRYCKYNEKVLVEYMNPHAGFLLLSNEQVQYASRLSDLKRRDKFYGGYMASALCNFLNPFVLFRDPKTDIENYNIHLDPIIFQPGFKNRVKNLMVDFLESHFCDYGVIFDRYKNKV